VTVPVQAVVEPVYVQPWKLQADEVTIPLHGVSVPEHVPVPVDQLQP
jgi:hypothetical protein